MSRQLLLYTTLGCHLCEQALDLLHEAKSNGFTFGICEVEISDSESLMAAYGVRIPVVKFEDSEQELGWPFQYDDLIDFIAATE